VKEEIRRVFDAVEQRAPDGHHPHVTMIVGVNGTGKTTTVGKLANLLKASGQQPLVCAADTFARRRSSSSRSGRSARTWTSSARRRRRPRGARVRRDSVGQGRGRDPILVDTAGACNTRVNLMNELDKIRRVAARAAEGAPHEVLLVLDATVGQNGLAQAREFTAVAGVTGIVPHQARWHREGRASRWRLPTT